MGSIANRRPAPLNLGSGGSRGPLVSCGKGGHDRFRDDFDIAGFSIGKTVGSDTRRYSFRNRIRVVDLGLRLAGVRTLDLESEVVSLGNVEPSKLRDRLR